MASPRILIVYGSHYGQTAKIAQRIADRLRASGDAVTLLNCDGRRLRFAPRGFDGVIVGASVNYGRHQRSIRRFITENRDALNEMPSAFFSVSGAAAGRAESDRALAHRYVDEFLRQTGWRPAASETVAGAMAYTKYNPLMRWMLERISARSGGPTDTSRDHEFTDWAHVDRFAESFAAALPRPEPAPPLATA